MNYQGGRVRPGIRKKNYQYLWIQVLWENLTHAAKRLKLVKLSLLKDVDFFNFH